MPSIPWSTSVPVDSGWTPTGSSGVEKSAEESPAWSEGHPLSEAANQLIGSMVRKVGGFTFQELNLTIDDIKATGEVGPDLSYDFITRPGYQHALVTGDTEFLRLTLREAMRVGIDQASLVHAMQNHDELTYELVHFATKHKDDLFTLGGEQLLGLELAETIRQTLRDKITGTVAPVQPDLHHRTGSPAPPPLSSPRRSESPIPGAGNRRARSSRSSSCTCCWRCTTRCSRASSRCPAGTCAAWSRSTRTGCGR